MAEKFWEIDSDPEVWGGFGSRDNWYAAYKRQHGYYPGEGGPGTEPIEEAIRNLRWSQEYWVPRHGFQPMTEEVWRSHYYRPEDWGDFGQFENQARNILTRYRNAALQSVQYQPVSGATSNTGKATQPTKPRLSPGMVDTMGPSRAAPATSTPPLDPEMQQMAALTGNAPFRTPPTSKPTTTPGNPWALPATRQEPVKQTPLPPFYPTPNAWGPTTPYTGLPAPATNRTPASHPSLWAPALNPPIVQQMQQVYQQAQAAANLARRQAGNPIIQRQSALPQVTPPVQSSYTPTTVTAPMPTTVAQAARPPLSPGMMDMLRAQGPSTWWGRQIAQGQSQPPTYPQSGIPTLEGSVRSFLGMTPPGQGYGRTPGQQPVVQRARQTVPPRPPTPTTTTQTPYLTSTTYPTPWNIPSLMNPPPLQQARDAYDRQQRMASDSSRMAAEARQRAEQQRRQAEQRQRQQQMQRLTNLERANIPGTNIPGFTDPYLNEPTGAYRPRPPAGVPTSQLPLGAQQPRRTPTPTIERQSAITPPSITSGQRSPTITIQTPGATINIEQNPWDAGQRQSRAPLMFGAPQGPQTAPTGWRSPGTIVPTEIERYSAITPPRIESTMEAEKTLKYPAILPAPQRLGPLAVTPMEQAELAQMPRSRRVEIEPVSGDVTFYDPTTGKPIELFPGLQEAVKNSPIVKALESTYEKVFPEDIRELNKMTAEGLFDFPDAIGYLFLEGWNQAYQASKQVSGPLFGTTLPGGYMQQLIDAGVIDFSRPEDARALMHFNRNADRWILEPNAALRAWPEYRAATTQAEFDALTAKYYNLTTDFIWGIIGDPGNLAMTTRVVSKIPVLRELYVPFLPEAAPGKVQRTIGQYERMLDEAPQTFMNSLDPGTQNWVRDFLSKENYLTQQSRAIVTKQAADATFFYAIQNAASPQEALDILNTIASGDPARLKQLAEQLGNNTPYLEAGKRIGAGRGQAPVPIARDIVQPSILQANLENIPQARWRTELAARLSESAVGVVKQRVPVLEWRQEPGKVLKITKAYADIAAGATASISNLNLFMRPGYAIVNALGDTGMGILDLGSRLFQNARDMAGFVRKYGFNMPEFTETMANVREVGPASRFMGRVFNRQPFKTFRNVNRSLEEGRRLRTLNASLHLSATEVKRQLGLLGELWQNDPLVSENPQLADALIATSDMTDTSREAQVLLEAWANGEASPYDWFGELPPDLKQHFTGTSGDLVVLRREVNRQAAIAPTADAAIDAASTTIEGFLLDDYERLMRAGRSGDVPQWHPVNEFHADTEAHMSQMEALGRDIGLGETQVARVQTDMPQVVQQANTAVNEGLYELSRLAQGGLNSESAWLLAEAFTEIVNAKKVFRDQTSAFRRTIIEALDAGDRTQAAQLWASYFPYSEEWARQLQDEISTILTEAEGLLGRVQAGESLADIADTGRFVTRQEYVNRLFQEATEGDPINYAAIQNFTPARVGENPQAFNEMLSAQWQSTDRTMAAMWQTAAQQGNAAAFQRAAETTAAAQFMWEGTFRKLDVLKRERDEALLANPAMEGAIWEQWRQDKHRITSRAWDAERLMYEQARGDMLSRTQARMPIERPETLAPPTETPINPREVQTRVPRAPLPTEPAQAPARATTPTGEGVVTPPARTPPVTETVTALTRQEKIDALLWREMDAGQPVNVAERRRELGRLSDNELNRLIDEAQGTPTTPARTAQPPQQTVPKAGPTVAQERPLPSVRTLGPRIEGWALDVTELGNQQARLQRRLRDDPRFTAYRTYLSTLQDYFEQGSLGWAEPSLEFAEGYVPTVPTLRPVIDAARREIDSAFGSGAFDNLEYSHETLVRRAAEAGRDVPQENLAHYADSDWYQDLLHRRQLAGPERPSPQQDVGLTPTTQPTLAPEVPPRAVTETQPAKADRAQLQQSIRDAAIKQDVESATKVGKPQEQRIIRKWLPGSKAKTLDSLSDNDLRNLQAKMGAGAEAASGAREPWMMSKVEFAQARPPVEGYYYHGSPAGNLPRAEPGRSRYHREGAGFYLTENRDVAESYAKGGSVNYVRLKGKPGMDMDAPADMAFWRREYADYDEGKWGRLLTGTQQPTNADVYRAIMVQQQHGFDTSAVESLEDALYGKGIEVTTHMEGKQGTPHRVYVVRNPDLIEIVSPEMVHRQAIEKALKAGQPVPPAVLADYPDLAAKYGGQTPPTAVPQPTGATQARQGSEHDMGMLNRVGITLKDDLLRRGLNQQGLDDLAAKGLIEAGTYQNKLGYRLTQAGQAAMAAAPELNAEGASGRVDWQGIARRYQERQDAGWYDNPFAHAVPEPEGPSPEVLVPEHARIFEQVLPELTRLIRDNWDGIHGAGARVQNMDAFKQWVNQVYLPRYREAEYIIPKLGKRIAEFTMGSPEVQYVWDSVLQGIFPYTYWATRQGVNTIRRVLRRPGILRTLLMHDEMEERERQAMGGPSRMEERTIFTDRNGNAYGFDLWRAIFPSWVLRLFRGNPQPGEEDKSVFEQMYANMRESIAPFFWVQGLAYLTGLTEDKPDLKFSLLPSIVPFVRNLTTALGEYVPQLGIPRGGVEEIPFTDLSKFDVYYFDIASDNLITNKTITEEQARIVDQMLREVWMGQRDLNEAIQEYEPFGKVWKHYVDSHVLPATAGWLTGFWGKTMMGEEQKRKAARRMRDEVMGPSPFEAAAQADGLNFWDLSADDQEAYRNDEALSQAEPDYWRRWYEQMPEAKSVAPDFDAAPAEALLEMAYLSFRNAYYNLVPPGDAGKSASDNPLIKAAWQKRDDGTATAGDYQAATGFLYYWDSVQREQPRPSEVDVLAPETQQPERRMVTPYDTSKDNFWALWRTYLMDKKGMGPFYQTPEFRKIWDNKDTNPDALTPQDWQAAAMLITDWARQNYPENNLEEYTAPDLTPHGAPVGTPQEYQQARERIGTLYDRLDATYPGWQDLEDEYYKLPEGDARQEFLEDNPRLTQSWDDKHAAIAADSLLNKYYGEGVGKRPYTPRADSAATTTTARQQTTATGSQSTARTPQQEAQIAADERSSDIRSGRAPDGTLPTRTQIAALSQVETQVEDAFPGWRVLRDAYLKLPYGSEERTAFRFQHPEYEAGYNLRHRLMEASGIASFYATYVDGKVFYYGAGGEGRGLMAAAERVAMGQGYFRHPLYQNLRGGEWGSGYGGGGSFRSPIQYRGIQSRAPQPVQWRGIGNVWRLPELRTKGR